MKWREASCQPGAMEAYLKTTWPVYYDYLQLPSFYPLTFVYGAIEKPRRRSEQAQFESLCREYVNPNVGSAVALDQVKVQNAQSTLARVSSLIQETQMGGHVEPEGALLRLLVATQGVRCSTGPTCRGYYESTLGSLTDLKGKWNETEKQANEYRASYARAVQACKR
jgi:hypothetical protein